MSKAGKKILAALDDVRQGRYKLVYPKGRLERREAYWTCDESAPSIGPLYYFAINDRAPPPYTTQRHVEAILDIASDGTLAGVELVFGDLPPPPRKKD